MYNHILVCYDDTEGSKKALKKAIDICLLNQDCLLSVVHVKTELPHTFDSPRQEDRLGTSSFTTIPRPDGGVYVTHLPFDQPINQEPSQYIPDNNDEDFSIKVKSILDPSGITAHYDTLIGDTAQSICEYAEENQIDLIIVGHSEKGVLKRIFIGSTGESILNNSGKDLLVVK